jgi:translation initiation factor 2B subunit (eIF-2B alpha/beta/delta family)
MATCPREATLSSLTRTVEAIKKAQSNVPANSKDYKVLESKRQEYLKEIKRINKDIEGY